METSRVMRVAVDSLGPITRADIQLGDLTALVGPQASGKSLFLRTLWAAVNGRQTSRQGSFYFDEAHRTHQEGGRAEKGRAFFIPARRDLAFYLPSDSFLQSRPISPVLSEFYDAVLEYIRGIPTGSPVLDEEVIPGAVLDQISRFVLRQNSPVRDNTNSIALQVKGGSSGSSLPLSFGQSNFISLALGACVAIRSQEKPPSERITHVLIEEPELGLHSLGTLTAMSLVFLLLDHGISVTLSTHSPTVLDVIWGIRLLQEHQGAPLDVMKMLMLSGEEGDGLSRSILTKSYRTYYFSLDGAIQDISSLDPGSENPVISGWGGLTGVSDHIGGVVSRVV